MKRADFWQFNSTTLDIFSSFKKNLKVNYGFLNKKNVITEAVYDMLFLNILDKKVQWNIKV